MDSSLNNRGFTLIELLAVLVILISISLVAVGGISASLEKRDKRECEEQIELAIGVAKIYFSLKDTTSVTIGQLKTENYFSNNKKVDRLKDTDTISLSENKYIYSGTDCG